jgi:malonate transporter and related proteins
MAPILDIVVPIFGFIVIGYALASTPLLSKQAADGLTVFVFYCAIPALLFRAGSRIFASEPLDFDLLIAFYLAGVVIYLGLALWLWRGRRRPLAESALAGMTSVFCNTGIMGLPLTYTLFGDHGLLLASSIVMVNGLLYFTLTTTLIELGQGQGSSVLKQVFSGLVGLAKNPVLISMGVGLLWGALALPVPGPAARLIDMLATAAPPVALVALGTSLRQFRLAGDLVEAAWLTVIKLILYPSAVAGLAIFALNLKGDALAVAVLVAAMPVGVNPFLLANRYGVYVARCGSAILLSTTFSIFSIAAVVALLVPGDITP